MNAGATAEANAGLVIIAALARQRVIGLRGAMPWHLPEDLKHFKDTTSGCAVIMGRKTLESILAALGKPLPNRRSIVITRNRSYSAPGCETAGSLAEAMHLAGGQRAFVIGGAEIYAQALPLADRMVLTEIDAAFEGDAWFPEFDRTEWIETSRQSGLSAKGLPYSFVDYRRNPNCRKLPERG